MKIKNFIKVTLFNREDGQPLGTALININEISFIMCVEENKICNSCIIMKDYATKLYVSENEKVIKYKINSAKTEV